DLSRIAQTSVGSWFRFNLGLRQICCRYFKRLRREQTHNCFFQWLGKRDYLPQTQNLHNNRLKVTVLMEQ
ncbi:MAG: hypothetical protein ACYTXT_43600, partial [Nostoc sp.]